MNLFVNTLGGYIWHPSNDNKIIVDSVPYDKCDPEQHFELWCQFHKLKPAHIVRILFENILNN